MEIPAQKTQWGDSAPAGSRNVWQDTSLASLTICLSDTDTASSLGCGKNAPGDCEESTRDSAGDFAPLASSAPEVSKMKHPQPSSSSDNLRYKVARLMPSN